MPADKPIRGTHVINGMPLQIPLIYDMASKQEIRQNIVGAFIHGCHDAQEEHALAAKKSIQIYIANAVTTLFVMSDWYAAEPHLSVKSNDTDRVPDEFYLFMFDIISSAEGPFIYSALRSPLMGYRLLIEVFYAELARLGYVRQKGNTLG